MAKTDANPPMPEFVTDYVLQEVDPAFLTQAYRTPPTMSIPLAVSPLAPSPFRAPVADRMLIPEKSSGGPTTLAKPRLSFLGPEAPCQGREMPSREARHRDLRGSSRRPSGAAPWPGFRRAGGPPHLGSTTTSVFTELAMKQPWWACSWMKSRTR